MKFTKLLRRAALAGCVFFHFALSQAQVPGLLSYQGRVTVGGAAFAGVGHFKFALVNADGTATYWSHDGSSAGGGEPLSAVTNAVNGGLTSLLLGDTNLANMAPLAPAVFLNPEPRLRVWFSDGTNGFAQLTPDQRIAAVGYAAVAASVPDGAITLNKLAAEVRSSLAGGPPSGGILLAQEAQATNLLNAGYVPLAAEVRQEEWQEDYLATSFDFGPTAGDTTNLWAGGRLWFWRWGGGGTAGRLAVYDSASNHWTLAASNGAPALDRASALVAWMPPHLVALGATPGGIAGARYRADTDAWSALNTNNAPALAGPFLWHNMGSELLVLGMASNGLRGAVYRAAADAWESIATNGLPVASLTGARLAGASNGWWLIGPGASGPAGARLQWPENTWSAFAVPANLPVAAETKELCTGTDWYFLAAGSPSPVIKRLRLGDLTWADLPAPGAPVAQADTRLFWTGTELLVMTVSAASAPGVSASAGYAPGEDRWRPLAAGPAFENYAPIELYWTGGAVLVVRVGEPSKWALYQPTRDRWQPVNGPVLGYEAINAWAGTELIAIVRQSPTSQDPMIYHYRPAPALKLYLKP